MNKKGLGAVIALALFLVVTVVSAITFQSWFSTYSSSIFVDVEQKDTNSANNFNPRAFAGGKLYVENSQNKSVEVISASIEGDTCESAVGSYSGTLVELDLTDCLFEQSGTGEKNIVVVTNLGVISYDEYVTSEQISNYGEISLSNPFISTWNTTNSGTSNSSQITLPLVSTGSYNFIVFWGDGSNDTITSYDQSEVTHDYASPGIYDVNVSGLIKGFRFAFGGDKEKITDISQWGDLTFTNLGRQFYGARNLVISASDSPDFTGITNLSYFFYNVDGLTNEDFTNWDVSEITDMSNLFTSADNFNGNISNWDTSSVTDISYMFSYASIFNSDISNWDVSSVTDMTQVFGLATAFNQSLNSWDVSSVTNMYSMFASAYDFNGDISSWNISNLVNMGNMFASAYDFNSNISNWNTSNITSMFLTFYEASSFNQDLSSWDVDQVTLCSLFNISTPAWTLPQPSFSGC